LADPRKSAVHAYTLREGAMRVSGSVRDWLRLPSRVALLLGLGALSAAGARADASEVQPGLKTAPSAGDLLIRVEGGRVYLSESGKEFRDLELGDTASARLLMQLIDDHGAAAGAAGIGLNTTRLAGDGGAGFHWTPADRADAPGTRGGSQQTGIPAKSDGTVEPMRPQKLPMPHDSTSGSAEKG
jgi:hypothetical protein